MKQYPHIVRLKQQASRRIRPTQIIYHSLANGYNFEGALSWLSDPRNPLESHIAVRKDGYRVQLVPYTSAADANYRANRRADGTGALSAETDSSVDATEPWTDDQVNSLVEWSVGRCREFSIPPRVCTGPDAPGLGWHTMWGAPGAWTPVAKSCPGAARIAQVRDVLVPRIAAALKGPGASPGGVNHNEEEEIMPVYSTKDSKGNAYFAVLGAGGLEYISKPPVLNAYWRAGAKTVALSRDEYNALRAPGTKPIP